MTYPHRQMYLPPPRHPRARWPIALASFVIGVAITAAGVGSISTLRPERAPRPAVPATITVTATPPATPGPAPLPPVQADRATCDAWHAAGEKIHAATRAQSVIPKELTVLSPQVRENPEWTAAVGDAADFYRQAADTLYAGIAAGTTIILDQAARSEVDALRTLATGYATFNAASGNAHNVMHEAAEEVDVLCERLAPR